jgi:hypothetical protein
MSGPIVRKYGFPNFEQIFGSRELQHGVDDEAETAAEPPGAEKPPAGSPETERKSKSRKKKS